MKTITTCICFLICFISSCKNQSTDSNEPYAGEFAFEQRKLDVIADPQIALEDTTILLKVTCYPKFTGTGIMGITLGAPQSWVVLEYPYKDTLKNSISVTCAAKFQEKKPFTQEWKFKLLRTFGGEYTAGVFVRMDSVFIADSSKMYLINSPELKKIRWLQPSGLLQYFTLSKP